MYDDSVCAAVGGTCPYHTLLHYTLLHYTHDGCPCCVYPCWGALADCARQARVYPWLMRLRGRLQETYQFKDYHEKWPREALNVVDALTSAAHSWRCAAYLAMCTLAGLPTLLCVHLPGVPSSGVRANQVGWHVGTTGACFSS